MTTPTIKPEPLKNKMIAASSKGIFYESKDVAAAVEWFKRYFGNLTLFKREEPALCSKWKQSGQEYGDFLLEEFFS